MKTTLHTLALIIACSLPAAAQQAVSARTSLAAGSVDPALDILPIVDISAGASGSKKITIDALFEGWGFTAAGETLAKAADAAAQRAALGISTTVGSWSEAVNTATPNATIPAVSWSVVDAASNADAAFLPKGTGAILAAIPDNTTTGGNKRGSKAVDFQMTRSAATQVASGTNSAVLGGASNTASGIASVAVGGSANTVSADYAVVLGGVSCAATSARAIGGGGDTVSANGNSSVAIGGFTNTTSAQYSAVIAGNNNTASGLNSFVAAGSVCTASGSFSFARGNSATTRGLTGMAAVGAGQFAGAGDAQSGSYVMRRATSNATPTELSLDGGAPAATTRIVLPNNSAYSFTGQVIARASGGDSAAWRFSGTIERGANAAATALIGTPTITDTDAEAGASAWVIALTADTTNGSLKLEVTGAAATDIRWMATVETAEVVY